MTYASRPPALITTYTINYILITNLTYYCDWRCLSLIYGYNLWTHTMMPHIIAFFASYYIGIVHIMLIYK